MSARLKGRVAKLIRGLDAELWQAICELARGHGLDPHEVGRMTPDEVLALIPEGVEHSEDSEHPDRRQGGKERQLTMSGAFRAAEKGPGSGERAACCQK